MNEYIIVTYEGIGRVPFHADCAWAGRGQIIRVAGRLGGPLTGLCPCPTGGYGTYTLVEKRV